MKKIYTLLSMSILGLSAVAAPKMASNVNDQKMLQEVDSRATTMNAETSKMRVLTRSVNKKIQTIDDLCGPWDMQFGFSFFKNTDYPGRQSISFIKLSENQIGLTNAPYSDVVVVGDVDMAKGTVTFATQDVLTIDANTIMEFVPHKGIPQDDESIKFEECSSLELKFDENGFIPVDPNYTVSTLGGYALLIKGNHSRGYYGVALLTLNGYEYNVFNEADWAKVDGQATYVDDVVNHFLQPDNQITDPVAVDCYVNKVNKNLVAIRNPYIAGGWNEINAAPLADKSGEGMLLLDLQEPEFVLLQMLTPSGMWINDAAQGEEPDYQELFIYNEEASFIYDGYEIEDALNEFYANEMETSTYDDATRTVSVKNIWFGMSSAPTNRYGFAATTNPDGSVKDWAPLTYEIVLPEGWTDGVESVEFDSNAPVKYFNLQGVEVANPEAGQIVIKKQGSKAVKVVVK